MRDFIPTHRYYVETVLLPDGRIRARSRFCQYPMQRTLPAGTSAEEAAATVAGLIEGREERVKSLSAPVDGTGRFHHVSVWEHNTETVTTWRVFLKH